MPILSTGPMNESLDNDYTARDTELALFDGDPALGGVELNAVDCPGYARATVLATDWNAAVDGIKTTTLIQFADATAPWETTATHWALIETGGTVADDGWDSGPLRDETGGPLDVTAAGPGPAIRVSVFYDDILEP